jgi:hypothetical protein
MPEGEEMFKYHGYSGPCPASPNSPNSPQEALKTIEADVRSLLVNLNAMQPTDDRTIDESVTHVLELIESYGSKQRNCQGCGKPNDYCVDCKKALQS